MKPLSTAQSTWLRGINRKYLQEENCHLDVEMHLMLLQVFMAEAGSREGLHARCSP
jgi:hypothetical protein